MAPLTANGEKRQATRPDRNKENGKETPRRHRKESHTQVSYNYNQVIRTPTVLLLPVQHNTAQHSTTQHATPAMDTHMHALSVATALSLAKGFDWQDDLLFCPTPLSQMQSQMQSQSQLQTQLKSPSTPTTASTQATTTATTISTPPASHTPRPKRVLDIVNPHTGLRVASSPIHH
jgi:hypothetical protein